MFLYYFPNTQAVNKKNMAEVLVACGLSNVLDGTHPQSHETPRGPDGHNGCICLFHPTALYEAVPLFLDPKNQTWRKCESGKFWLGYRNDAKPGPNDLTRAEQIMGYVAPLGDGNLWSMPTAVAWDGTHNFPEQATFGEDGKTIREILPKYLDLSSRVRKIATSYYDSGDWGISKDEALMLAIEALGLNYRIGKYEVGALGLFAPEEICVARILWALIDEPTHTQKKMTSVEQSNTQGGATD